MENIKNHSLQIEYGQGLVASGVAEVVGFNEREIRFKTDSGVKTIVLGDNLKINAFNKQTGELKVGGAINSVKYGVKPLTTIKNLFK